MALNRLKGLLTENDRRRFLRDVYEESVIDNTQKMIRSFSREEFYGGPCPYCRTVNVFVNQGMKRYGDREFVIAKCDGAPPQLNGCGNTVLIKVRVKQEGDVVMGFKFTPFYEFHTVGEIDQKYGPGIVEGIDEDTEADYRKMENERSMKVEEDRKKKLQKQGQLRGFILK